MPHSTILTPLAPFTRDDRFSPQGSQGIPEVRQISSLVLKDWLKDPQIQLIDVRERAEHQAESIPQAQLCPKSDFDPQQFPWNPQVTYVCHCRSGVRSQQVAEQLAQYYGGVVYNLLGGIEAWKAHDLPIHTSENLP